MGNVKLYLYPCITILLHLYSFNKTDTPQEDQKLFILTMNDEIKDFQKFD